MNELQLKTKLLKLMFNEGEAVNITNSRFDVSTQLIGSIANKPYSLVTINPLRPNSTRLDCNITSYRNLLFEIDKDTDGNKVSREKQIEIFNSIELPTSAAIWSGSKSLHVLVCLEESQLTILEYKELHLDVQHAIKYASGYPVDENNMIQNGCRFPFGINEKTDNIQELVWLNERVKLADLKQWLSKYPKRPPKPVITHTTYSGPFNPIVLTERAKRFLRSDGQDFEWNKELFFVASDCCRKNATIEQTEALLETVTGYLDNTDYRTIQSAFNRHNQEQTEGFAL